VYKKQEILGKVKDKFSDAKKSVEDIAEDIKKKLKNNYLIKVAITGLLPFYFALKRSTAMNKNLMSKMIKSNDINRGQYTYIYGGHELADIVTRGGKQYTRNDVFDLES
jgi:shikimate kinase